MMEPAHSKTRLPSGNQPRRHTRATRIAKTLASTPTTWSHSSKRETSA